MNCSVSDIVYYNEGYLLILSFELKGTTWYVPFPVHRDQISANLNGQNTIGSSASDDINFGIVGAIFKLILIGIAILFVIAKPVETIGILVLLSGIFGGINGNR